MPAEWAASGQQVRVSGITVQFLDEQSEVDEPRLNGLGKREEAYRLRVVGPGTFTGDDGADVPVDASATGAWSRVLRGAEGEQEYRLRFFLELPDGVARGDVELPPERVFFTTAGPLSAVGQASRLGVSKEGTLTVKRVRTFMQAVQDMGKGPKMQWGEAMYTVGRFTMTPE